MKKRQKVTVFILWKILNVKYMVQTRKAFELYKPHPIKPCKLCAIATPCTIVSKKCLPFLNSKNVGKMFGKSVYILSIFVFVKFSTFSKIKNGKNREIVKHFWYDNFIDNILSFGPHMNPTNLYWMTLKEIYIFGHVGLQIQGGILHSKIMFFAKI